MTGSTAGVVLAAGRSRRAGPVDKLTVEVEGEAMIRRVVRTALEAGLDPVVVVTAGPGSGAHQAVRDLAVRTVVNPQADEGMGASVARGIGALPGGVSGAVIVLGDMPWVRSSTIEALRRAFETAGAGLPLVPVHAERRGNPVLWPADRFPALRALGGDVGARSLLTRVGYRTVLVDDPGIHRDVDTPADLHTLDAPPST